MPKITRMLLVLVALGLALPACGGANSAMPAPAPAPSRPSNIDAIVQQNYPLGWGVEIAIYKHGVLDFQKGYGLRDRGLPDQFEGANFWGIEQTDQLFHVPRGRFAPDASTVFDLASVSKEFTAAAILLLQQDGKLSVNDTVAKYFPAFPNGNAITLLYLLQHRSGLIDYNNFGSPPDFSGAYSAFMTSGETNYQPIVDELGTFPLLFTPGSQFSYSNSNYLLLGVIVAKVSGEPLGAFLQQRIFAPLGMTQTHQGYPAAPVTDLAFGYHEDGNTIFRSWQPNLQWLAGPGGLTSTVGDLEKWDEAVRQPGVFTHASLTQMFTPSPIGVSYGTYADGWFISQLDGHLYIWHDGFVGGFQTMNAMFPNDGVDIIILTNTGSGPDPYYLIPALFPIALTLH
jgi:CubicO group peptidase (beta-lactamase class C family)